MEDRRKRRRQNLKYPLLFRRANESAVASETENFTLDGFYCLVSHPFAPEERLDCVVALPYDPTHPERRHLCFLIASVVVIHLALDDLQRFGLGCQIASYQVVAPADLPEWAVEAGFGQVARYRG